MKSIYIGNLDYYASEKLILDLFAQFVEGPDSQDLNTIGLDPQDLKTIMSHKGLAFMSIGEGEGEDAPQQAIKSAIENLVFDNISINGSLGVIICFEFNSKMPFMQIASSLDIIRESAGEDADIIFSTMPKDNFDENKVRVSIIITGIEKLQVQKNL